MTAPNSATRSGQSIQPQRIITEARQEEYANNETSNLQGMMQPHQAHYPPFDIHSHG